MPSALAAQLAASTSLNASLLQDRSKKRKTESYLFTGRDADLHDIDSIHALASTAFSHLRSLSPVFSSKTVKFGADGSSLSVDLEQELFSDAARVLDRTLQTNELNATLDRHIDVLLALLGPWLMEAPTSKILEWLVRRFRINEFNVEALLTLFLPSHESPHFVKMLSILHIQPNSPFSFLLPFKSAAKSLPRSTLIKAMVSNTDVARFVSSILPTAIKCSHSHRTLLAFHVATMHDYISTVTSLDDGVLAFILPSLLTPLQTSQKDANVVLGSFALLCTLSQRVNLKPAAVSAIISALTTQVRGARGSGKGTVSTAQFVKTAVAICSSQEDVQGFPLGACQLCTKMTGFASEISSSMAMVGAERFILPLVRSLRDRVHEHRVSSLFSTLINTTNAPLVVIKELCRILVHISTSTPDADLGELEPETGENNARVARSLLSLVHQRHPVLLKDIADEILSEVSTKAGESNEDRKARRKLTNELLTSFSRSHPLAESSNVNEIIVASSSTSRDARAASVEKMYSTLESAKDALSAPDMASIQSALLGRIYDTHAGVLQALYDSPDLFLSTIVPTTSPQQLLDIVSSQLLPTPPARAVLLTHVGFLAGPFVKAYLNLTSAIQHTVLFPFLLASKTKFRTTRGVWEAIKESGGFQTGWLRGCVDIWDKASYLGEKEAPENDKDGNDGGDEKICGVNLDVAAKIAASRTLMFYCPKLHDSNSHARALAYLVCRALLMQTSGDEKTLLALRFIRCMRVSLIEARDSLSLEEASDAHHVGTKIVIKPGGRNTNYALQASILALIPALPAPAKFSAAWISVLPAVCVHSLPPVGWSHAPKIEQIPNDTSQCYVSLMQEVYALASTSAAAAPSEFSTSVLQALFLNLKDSSLSFLLGILLSTSPSLEKVRMHALLHVLAFIRGHSGDRTIDFQTVLPSLIAILLDARSDKRDRSLVFESILLLGSTSEKKHMYCLDTLYGSASARLEYVDTKDLSTYVKALVNHREQLIQDADYMRVFHQQHLESSNTKYKRRVLCFLLSHVISHPFSSARITLLRSLENVTDLSKPHMLLPVVKDITQDTAAVATVFGTSFEVYVSLVVGGFLSITSADLANRDDDDTWPVFIAGLRFYFHSNSDASVRKLYTDAIEQRLFMDLDLERRSEVCAILLQAGSEGGEVYVASRALLGKLLGDVALIAHLLARFRPEQVENTTPLSKRAKLDQAPRASELTKLQPLSLLAEVLGTTDIPGSLDLISALLDTLNKVVRSDLWGPSDTSYICQMLMAAIEKSASKVMEPPAMPIRLDVLVELIRVTDNPQTFNEALLLMAHLVRLAPDSVLHNIMPIFTFMGSNIFHRDDSYSFKVVQNTIDSIVPVMVSSLKTKHLGGLDLYIGARDFLRIFTDASNHIPRHRRHKFFVHLSEVLGAQSFLAPICMLLVDKVTNRASRQTAEEAQTTLALPTSLLRHFDRSWQLFVLTEVLKECVRLRSQLLAPESAGLAFLDYPRDGEHSSSTSAMPKRRIQALILFVSTSLTPSGSDEVQGGGVGNTTDVVTHLLDLATLPTDHTSESDVTTVVAAAQTAIERIMNVISAREFLVASRVMLASDDIRIKTAALGVISARMSLVTEKLREECQATIIELIGLVRDIIEHQSAGPLVESALAALKAVGSTCHSGEEPALLSTLPHILKVVRSRTSAAAGISVLPYLITTLGPRIIPHFRDIVKECTSILREGLKGKTQVADVGEAALATLHSLLSSLPAFYGEQELGEIAMLYVDYSASFRRTKQSSHRSDQGDFETNVARSVTPRVLNENAFRPLFRRMHDWAFADEKATDERRITFCHVYTALLDYFKGLMNLYMSTLLRPLTEVLQTFTSSSKASLVDFTLWSGVITTLTKSLEADDSCANRRPLAHPISRPPRTVRDRTEDGAPRLGTSADLLKRLNLDLLMHTRSEDARVRILALQCATEMWKAEGGKLIGFVGETATFIAECAEDENESVVRETHNLKNAVESVAGSISGL
ncbi:hypothetical protein JVU11DRAFT_8847 [Chiua virens]|nr:hypothetical protein JVU11DRAFT_8847 [Chiua virens]